MKFELRNLFIDRRFWTGPFLPLLALLAVENLCVNIFAPSLQEARQKNLMMMGNLNGAAADPSKSNWDESCGEAIDAYWPYIPDARKQRLIVLSGMSQMFSIDDRKPGDQIISQWMDDALKPQGIRVWCESAPNACNEEITMQMLAFCLQPRTTPAVFIYGLCFDKFRNVDLRPGYQEFMRNHPDLQTAWRQTAGDYAQAYPVAAAKMRSSLDALHQSDVVQEATVESRIRDGIGVVSPLVLRRKDLNAAAAGFLFDMRNLVFHIKPTDKRPIIQSRYDLNREFLALMADYAKAHHVQFVVYVIPLNPLADNPYVASEYAGFKTWAEKFATDRSIPFANLENLIPPDDWGIFMGGPDFKHFKGVGHKKTAETLLQTFRPWILGEAAANAGTAGGAQ